MSIQQQQNNNKTMCLVSLHIRQHKSNNNIISNNIQFLFIGILIGLTISAFIYEFIIWDNKTTDHNNVNDKLRHYKDMTIPISSSSSSSSSSSYSQIDNANNNNDDGWKTLHVYIGKNATLSNHIVNASEITNDYYYNNEWFSQYQQDYIIYRLLHNKTAGYFIDLAANDAIRISNTYALERYHGWNGIAIEPNSQYWSGLSYRTCHVIAAVIGGTSSNNNNGTTNNEVLFKFPHEKAPKGGIVGNQFKNNNNNIRQTKSAKYSEKEYQLRYTVSLKDIFKRYNVPAIIDYISLDVEGAETYIMKDFPYDSYKFKVLTIEHPDNQLINILNHNGYENIKLIRKSSGETLWIHKDFKNTMDLSALLIDTESYKYSEK